MILICLVWSKLIDWNAKNKSGYSSLYKFVVVFFWNVSILFRTIPQLCDLKKVDSWTLTVLVVDWLLSVRLIQKQTLLSLYERNDCCFECNNQKRWLNITKCQTFYNWVWCRWCTTHGIICITIIKWWNHDYIII